MTERNWIGNEMECVSGWGAQPDAAAAAAAAANEHAVAAGKNAINWAAVLNEAARIRDERDSQRLRAAVVSSLECMHPADIRDLMVDLAQMDGGDKAACDRAADTLIRTLANCAPYWSDEIMRRALVRECEAIDPNGEYADGSIGQLRAALTRLRSVD